MVVKDIFINFIFIFLLILFIFCLKSVCCCIIWIFVLSICYDYWWSYSILLSFSNILFRILTGNQISAFSLDHSWKLCLCIYQSTTINVSYMFLSASYLNFSQSWDIIPLTCQVDQMIELNSIFVVQVHKIYCCNKKQHYFL